MMSQINDSICLKPMDSDLHVKEKALENNASSCNVTNSVNLSETSKQLEQLKASLKNIPEINLDRVLQFKTEITLGNYQMNSNEIASKMLDLEPA